MDLTITALRMAQGGATMPAGVEKAMQITQTVASDHDRTTPNAGHVEIVRFWNLAIETNENPATLENVGHFQLE